MREGLRTFQKGLSNPDFLYRPRQIYERRGRYKGGTDAMLEGLSTSSGQRVTTDPGVSVVFKGGD
jgi:hypothetical protein